MDRATAAKSALIALLLLATGAVAANANLSYRTTDFFCLYQGSHALVVGADPYDEEWWRGATDVAFALPMRTDTRATPPCPGRYGYPLWTAVALLPLGLVPIEIAALLWATLTIAAVVLGAAAVWRAVGGPRRLAIVYAVLIAASQPLWILLLTGQMSGIELGAAAAAALALSRERRRVAGISLAALALKPQIAAVAVPAVLLASIRSGRGLLVSTTAVAGALMTVVPIAFVARWPIEWLGELLTRRIRVTGMLPTAWGFASDVLGDGRLGVVLCLALVALVWLLVHDRAMTPLDMLVLSLPLSLFVAPYAWSYDHLVLAIPWAFVLARAPAAGRTRIAALLGIIVVATLLPWTLYAVAFARGAETLSAIVPALNAIAVAWAIRAHAPAPVSIRSVLADPRRGRAMAGQAHVARP